LVLAILTPAALEPDTESIPNVMRWELRHVLASGRPESLILARGRAICPLPEEIVPYCSRAEVVDLSDFTSVWRMILFRARARRTCATIAAPMLGVQPAEMPALLQEERLLALRSRVISTIIVITTLAIVFTALFYARTRDAAARGAELRRQAAEAYSLATRAAADEYRAEAIEKQALDYHRLSRAAWNQGDRDRGILLEQQAYNTAPRGLYAATLMQFCKKLPNNLLTLDEEVSSATLDPFRARLYAVTPSHTYLMDMSTGMVLLDHATGFTDIRTGIFSPRGDRFAAMLLRAIVPKADEPMSMINEYVLLDLKQGAVQKLAPDFQGAVNGSDSTPEMAFLKRRWPNSQPGLGQDRSRIQAGTFFISTRQRLGD